MLCTGYTQAKTNVKNNKSRIFKTVIMYRDIMLYITNNLQNSQDCLNDHKNGLLNITLPYACTA